MHTGCGISLRTLGVASKPVQPRPLPFAGFFIYVKRKFVANLKVIGPLVWKKWIFQFYRAIYMPCNLEFILERPKAIARPWWILQKIFFVTFKRFIPKQFFSLNMNFSESINGFRTASKNCSKTYAAPCRSPNLNPFLCQPNPIGPGFGSWGPTQPVWIRKLGPKFSCTQKTGQVWPH